MEIELVEKADPADFLGGGGRETPKKNPKRQKEGQNVSELEMKKKIKKKL